MTELKGHILNAAAHSFKMKGINILRCAVIGKKKLVTGWCDVHIFPRTACPQAFSSFYTIAVYQCLYLIH